MADSAGTRKITLGFIIGWILGVILIVPALGELFKQPLTGLALLVASLILLPPTIGYIQKKGKFHLSEGVKALLVIVLLGIAAVTNKSSGTMIETAQPQVNQPSETPIIVSATDLYAAYEANGISADAQYKNKLLEVSGVIDSVGKDILDSPFIALKTNNIIGSIQCMLDNDSEANTAANLSIGTRITVVGKNSGKLMNVLLRECRIKP